jgi:hypothetical protein
MGVETTKLGEGAAGSMGGVDFSRNPSDYRPDPGGHFRRRRDDREVPWCVIKMAIEGGEPFPDEADDNYVALKTTYLGYDFEVVIDPDNQYVVTTYPDDDW